MGALSTVDYDIGLYTPCLKESALESAAMPYRVEAKELRYLL
jgi:hypothetical protein